MPNQRTRRERRHRGLRSLYVWHRWLGVASALIVLMLAVTGILLNHGHGLGLDRSFVGSGWLLDWYGIGASPPTRAYKVAGHWLSEADGEVFLDVRPVATLGSPLVAATEAAGLVIAASRDALLLISPDGELVERMNADALPGHIRTAASTANRIVLDTDKGRFVGNTELLRWEAYVGPMPATASQALLPPSGIANAIAQAARARNLTWERVIADLHSGRVFGHFGTLAMDIAAVGFMVLALSGLWLWTRYLRSQQRRQRGH